MQATRCAQRSADEEVLSVVETHPKKYCTSAEEYLLRSPPTFSTPPRATCMRWRSFSGLLDQGDRGLPALLAYANRGRGHGPLRISPREPSNRLTPGSRMNAELEATSGLEPLYEALQASA